MEVELAIRQGSTKITLIVQGPPQDVATLICKLVSFFAKIEADNESEKAMESVGSFLSMAGCDN
jgi:hypothetical protein